jgi:hypothetical protein
MRLLIGNLTGFLLQGLVALGLDPRLASRHRSSNGMEHAEEDNLLAVVLDGIAGILSEPVRFYPTILFRRAFFPYIWYIVLFMFFVCLFWFDFYCSCG